MANIYKLEDGRQDTVLRVFENHKMYIKPTTIRKYRTGQAVNSDI